MNESDLSIRVYRPEDQEPLIELWRRSGLVVPWNDPGLDIARKLKVNPEGLLVGFSGERLVASVMAGYEGHRGWINYLAVDPDLQMRGMGRRMMDEAEALLRSAGCPKINLQVRTSNQKVIQFYRSIGYKIDDVVSMGKRLVEDPERD